MNSVEAELAPNELWLQFALQKVHGMKHGARLVLVVGLLSYAAPDRVAMILTLWALASVPLGIAIGHCTLSEDDATALETPDGVGQTG